MAYFNHCSSVRSQLLFRTSAPSVRRLSCYRRLQGQADGQCQVVILRLHNLILSYQRPSTLAGGQNRKTNVYKPYTVCYRNRLDRYIFETKSSYVLLVYMGPLPNDGLRAAPSGSGVTASVCQLSLCMLCLVMSCLNVFVKACHHNSSPITFPKQESKKSRHN